LHDDLPYTATVSDRSSDTRYRSRLLRTGSGND
jgi:hypothetical protein